MIDLPISILSRDERRKAAVAEHGEHLVVDYFRATFSSAGEVGWRFDRRAEVKVQPVQAALDLIEKIVNAPPRVHRGR